MKTVNLIKQKKSSLFLLMLHPFIVDLAYGPLLYFIQLQNIEMITTMDFDIISTNSFSIYVSCLGFFFFFD